MKKAYAIICRIEEIIAVFGLCGCTVSLFIGAVTRTVGYPIRYTYDVALFLFAWSIFLGADAAFRNDRLVIVEVLFNSVSASGRRILCAVNYFLIAAFLFLMTYNGTQLCYRSWRRPWPTLPNISYGWVTMSVPIGCFLLLITTCLKFRERVIKRVDVVADYRHE